MTIGAIESLPFFRRSHGAFTRSNEDSIRSIIEDPRTTGVFDPFIGRGRGLYNSLRPDTALCGVELLPAVYLLGYLDRPDVVAHAGDLHSDASRKLAEFRGQDALSPAGEFIEGWMTPSQSMMLGALGASLGLDELPGQWGHSEPRSAMVAAAAIVCSARLFTSWRTTKNAVWFKAGGIAVERSPIETAQRFLDRWIDERGQLPFRRAAPTDVVLADITDMNLKPLPSDINAIATSPPYANGHNYARQWAPESAVADAMGFATLADRQIGVSTKSRRPSEDELASLPLPTQVQLKEIRESTLVKDSSTYYFRRFAGYALGLKAALENVDRAVTSGAAKALIVLRDTTHGDTLFQSSVLVEAIMTDLGWTSSAHERRVIRSHIGNKQRSKPRVVGKAQLEHTLWFER